MKATGIVRRIDDLGRIVIPKEIRRILRIKEGNPLEIFTDRDGGVILKKYSPIGELADFSKDYAESMQKVIGNIILITDRDVFISASGIQKKPYLDKKISEELENIIDGKSIVTLGEDKDNTIPLLSDEDKETYSYQIIAPIFSEGEAIGSVIILSKDKALGSVEEKLAETAAIFLGKQMES